ncbi:MAG: heparinase II/III family protein, partial [Asticcacaulis sp.]
GYVLGEASYVKAALLGLKGDGKTGFLRQIDELFSPDGYYTEGPYYQRYALQPFELFASYIDRYDATRKIFAYRDGMLVKAVYALINLSYEGKFFPLNDAIVEKGIDSPELIQALAIVYVRNKDPQLLSVSTAQGSVAFSREGAVVATAIAAGLSKPFVFKPQRFRDGAKGDEGAVAVLRAGSGKRAQAVVFKATAQGMGHGHFDRLSYIYYDARREVLTDYGAARYLNVEAKRGGRYLPENESWAKQTLAHNTLVVDERSQFDADADVAQPVPTQFLEFGDTPEGLQFASARLVNAYAGQSIMRAVMLYTPKGGRPLLIDVVRARGQGTHAYDLPFWYRGVFLDATVKFAPRTQTLEPLGKANGYQHLWRKAEADISGPQRVSWFNTDRFYSLHIDAPEVSKAVLAQLGANDPEDNLRPERALILRATGQKAFNSACVLESYGDYDPAAESARDTQAALKSVRLFQDGARDLVRLTGRDGKETAIGIDWGGASEGQVAAEGASWRWRGVIGVASKGGQA